MCVCNYVKKKHVRAETVPYFARRLCLQNKIPRHWRSVWNTHDHRIVGDVMLYIQSYLTVLDNT
jgi:hypothetical protein